MNCLYVYASTRFRGDGIDSQGTDFEQATPLHNHGVNSLDMHAKRETLQFFLIAASGGSIAAFFVVVALMVGASQSTTIASTDVSEMLAVEPNSLSNAATTLDSNVSGELVMQAQTCRVLLAQITISTEPGAPTQTIRVRSGSYVSPEFQITGVPQRIAIPFPAPYPAGRA
jgi:hypothetical protein